MSADRNHRSGAGRLRPPRLGLLLAEARSLLELNASVLAAPLLMQAPKGDGHPVLVLPGFLASDLSTLLLRRFLTHLGYEAHAWKLGRNTGGVYRMRAQLRARLAEIHHAGGRKVSLIGWSLGGIYARDLALHSPEMVRSVITMGSPFAGDAAATNASKIYEILSGERLKDAKRDDLRALAGDLPVPTTSIFSRTDGVVNWRTCLLRPSATAENIEVYLASHVGLGVNAAVLWSVADRLAQPEGQFRPFDRRGPFAMAYAPARAG
ncbi:MULTISPECIES: alpha/beta hydrolase [Rhodopseudomonas]|uniref:Alpha/beta hydrolase n=1 Tax=Rhodopseudomonas palustris TaxID=1076 RepID=A0A0D7EE22_RHOPL|nr:MULTISPECIES: alpha/beta hydrolase [Rhodopseudomonas]KIZ38881.1 alpha/beta hydrolase [Rhodopseudomonas palustris]MDF3809815.1 alpha/beta hydrolase [Rhodopseudomonas sp. BAL398]WOK20115.1 alpha/beta hydrolase [Rhodopseudomonas sp. BAL398]